MKDQSDDPSHHERTLLPLSYISLPTGIRFQAYWYTADGKSVRDHFLSVNRWNFTMSMYPLKSASIYPLFSASLNKCPIISYIEINLIPDDYNFLNEITDFYSIPVLQINVLLSAKIKGRFYQLLADVIVHISGRELSVVCKHIYDSR